MPTFKTLTAPSEAEYTIQRSRFIAQAFPVTTEEAAQKLIKAVKKKYYDARHNCAAFRLGPTAAIARSSDDGEPSGTAGAPILEAITRNELTDILIVVTRYFGGIKLGAGGLTRAYSHAAMLAINAAVLALPTLFCRWTLTTDYPLLRPIESFLQQNEISIEDSLYTEKVSLTILLLPEKEESILADLTNITAGKIQYSKQDEIIINVPV